MGNGDRRRRGVWALGHYGDPDSHFMALYLRWTGSEWEIAPAPSGEGLHQTPTALSGSSMENVWAVGSEPTSSFLLAHWDGSAWSTVDAEVPAAGADSPSLSDVVSVSPTDVWAVGRYQGQRGEDGTAQTIPLIEHWDGFTWKVMEAPPFDE